MSAKFDFKKYLTDNFIESGTYKGDGVIRAIKAGFKNLYSVEIHEPNYNNSRNRINNFIKKNKLDISFPNIYLGDCVQVFPKIMTEINSKSTFWLDGHAAKKWYGAKSSNCPLLEELEIIKNHHIKNHIIMIDDLRIIRNEAWGEKDISEEILIEKIKTINSDYKFSYEDGHVEKDCLIAYI
jgi:hypothetical protein